MKPTGCCLRGRMVPNRRPWLDRCGRLPHGARDGLRIHQPRQRKNLALRDRTGPVCCILAFERLPHFQFRILGLGENVAAAVVLMPGANTTSTEIKVFLSDHLAPFKIPQHVFVKAELPKGATGKILRRKLSEEAAHRIREITPGTVALELQILEVWQRLIGRDDIGVDDNFFEAGATRCWLPKCYAKSRPSPANKYRPRSFEPSTRFVSLLPRSYAATLQQRNS